MRRLFIALACVGLVYSTVSFSFAGEKAAKVKNTAWVGEFNKEDIDLSGLDKEASNLMLKVLNENNCTCGCNEGSIANCITHDKKCGYSRKIAREMVKQAKQGKPEAFLLGMVEGYYLFKQEKRVDRRVVDKNKVYDINVDKAPWQGTKTSPITIVEFTDFQCPYCVRAAATLKKVMQAYPGQIQFYIKNNPLSFHKQAFGAALASLAANEQGKYWEMYDALFKSSKSLTMENINKFAEGIGLDMEQFKKDMESQELKDRIKSDQSQARKVRATGTPAIYINGKKVGGAIPFRRFKEIIDGELAKLKAKPAN